MNEVLRELLGFMDGVRGSAVVSFGRWAGPVTEIAQILAAIFAVLQLAFGFGLWAPPRGVVRLPHLSERLAGLASVAIVVWLYVQSRDPSSTVSFLRTAGLTTATLIVAALLYAVAYGLLVFRCSNDKTPYMRGLELQPDAKTVLESRDNSAFGPDSQRQIKAPTRPPDATSYFCGVDRNRPEFVWTIRSLVASNLILLLTYLAMAVSAIVLLISAALAIQEVDIRVETTPAATIARLPADILFDFGSATLRADVDGRLEPIADLIRQRHSDEPVQVVGHTDSIGSDADNLQLSRRRAAAVADWLSRQEGLSTARFAIDGRGESDPVAPNTFPDGADNPEGRRQNRRVIVRIGAAGGA